MQENAISGLLDSEMTACVITINKIGMRQCSIELNLLNENLKYKANV